MFSFASFGPVRADGCRKLRPMKATRLVWFVVLCSASACGRSDATPQVEATAPVPPPVPIPMPIQAAPAPVAPPAAPAAIVPAVAPSPAVEALGDNREAASPTREPNGRTPELEVSSESPNFGTIELAPGFTPDPNTTNVTSGGTIDASTLGGVPAGCAGWVTSRPDVVLNLASSSPMLRFFVQAAEQGGDTTLVINDGAGAWHCNDDVEEQNFNPMVDIANAPAGHYDIWIGSYSESEQVRGTLHITELTSQRPE